MERSRNEKMKETKMWGYRPDRFRTALAWIAIVSTGFLLRIFFHWMPRLFLKATHRQCSLRNAEKVLVKDEFNQYFIHKIRVCTVDGTEVRLLQRSLWKRRPMSYQMQSNITMEDETLMRYFTHKKLKFVWRPEEDYFVEVQSLNMCLTKDVHDMASLSFVEANRRRVFYGANVINVPITPLIKVLVLQLINPFYVFQVFSCILWYFDEYWQYATCIIIESALSLTLAVIETRRNERSLRNTIESSGQALVYREGEYRELPTDLLVPGDIIEIPRNGCTMHCDAVLLSGHGIVNESMLTGESVPVSKVPKPVAEEDHTSHVIDMKEHSRHILFSGTKVIQTRNYEGEKVRALVLRTGFLTSKGELVRAIMFPKPMRYKFDRDILHYLIVLSIFAGIGFIYTIAIMISYNKPASLIIRRALDIITVVVPPALPAAMAVGIVFSLRRLKKGNNIYCIAPNTINVCGGVDVVALDKTGTITEEGLDLRKILSTRSGASRLVEEGDPRTVDSASPLISCMAAAHSLAYIEGTVCGDPIDLKMFEAIGWHLEEPQVGRSDGEGDTVQQMVPRVVTFHGGPSREIGLLREFPFSSTLQRMAVLGRVLGETHFTLFVKGSPEMVRDLSLPETLPPDLDAKLDEYTQRGFRVLALAQRRLPKLSVVRVHRVSREEVERELTFVGLLVMENRLKKESKPTIQVLKGAKIRPVMITGDNILTALSVARDCCIIGQGDRVVRVFTHFDTESGHLDVQYQEVVESRKRTYSEGDTSQDVLSVIVRMGNETPELRKDSGSIHLALTGREWADISRHRAELLPRLGVKGSVFARFSPDQKAEMIETMQELGYIVAMCGDGANDCGALKTAHSGISLSQAEASVASPFTSKRQDISCVPALIREGRCALVTSFGIFKYMAGYSLTQFISVLILYYLKLNLTDAQYLWVDLITITSLSITFGYTRPAKVLCNVPPPNRLINIPTILSIVCLQTTNAAFMVGTLYLVSVQPWFKIRDETKAVIDEQYDSYENTVLFIISSFQYISFAFIFAKGYPYRRNFYTNIFFTANFLILVGLTTYIALGPFAQLKAWLEMVDLPLEPRQSMAFRLLLVGLAAANFFILFFIETALDSILFRRLLERARKARLLPNKKPPYARLSEKLRQTAWPVNELERCTSLDMGSETMEESEKARTAQMTTL